MRNREPWGFCETPQEKCTMNYCDENGCQNRKRSLVMEEPYSHSPTEPEMYFAAEFDTLQEGDWFQGTEEQYRKVLDLGTKEKLKREIPMYIVSALHRGFIAFVRPSTLSWQSCDKQTQLTPKEFIRRAENTFKTK